MSARRGTTRRAALAAAAALAAVSVGLAPAPAAQGCAPIDHPGLGRACPEPGGLWRVFLDDGTSVLTHGPDPAEVATHNQPPVYIPPKAPRCTKSTEFHNRVLYAYPSDRSSLLPYNKTSIVDLIEAMNGLLRYEAAEFGVRVDYRMLCSSGAISISSLRLATPHDGTNFGSVVNDARRAGHASLLAKYWIFVQGVTNQPGGVATVAPDDSPVDHNLNNFGPMYAVAFSWGAMMHENGHTLGAVQQSAPNSTGPPNGQGGGMHCNDGRDIMCYPDNGSQSAYQPDVCRRTHYDCRHDDYFNPRPSNGTYLANHWNIGSPMNRFFSGCLYASGTLAAGLGGVEVGGVSMRAHGVSSSCSGARFVLSGVVAPPRELDMVEQRIPFVGLPSAVWLHAAAPAPDFNVCWYKGSTKLKCHSALGTDSGTVPSGATTARILFNAGANGFYVLNAI